VDRLNSAPGQCLLDFSATLIAEPGARPKLCTTLRAGRRLRCSLHLRAAIVTELRPCHIGHATLRTIDFALIGILSLVLRLVHCIRHSAGHRIANCKACAQTGAAEVDTEVAGIEFMGWSSVVRASGR